MKPYIWKVLNIGEMRLQINKSNDHQWKYEINKLTKIQLQINKYSITNQQINITNKYSVGNFIVATMGICNRQMHWNMIYWEPDVWICLSNWSPTCNNPSNLSKMKIPPNYTLYWYHITISNGKLWCSQLGFSTLADSDSWAENHMAPARRVASIRRQGASPDFSDKSIKENFVTIRQSGVIVSKEP